MSTKTSQPVQQKDYPAIELRQEYDELQALFNLQPQLIQRFLESQVRLISEAIINRQPQVQFSLPDRVICPIPETGKTESLSVPPDERLQMAGGLVDRLTKTDLRNALHQRLSDLEQSSTPAITICARLIQYATAIHMVHGMLPAGKSVSYTTVEGEEIPTNPVVDVLEPESAITATTDAIVVEGQEEDGRGELLVPYVPAARRFYLPQWVAFDDQNRMVVRSVNEAEAHVASMQRFLSILHTAVSLAPYMVADEVYQQKRYGMMGQLVNQGRALAQYLTQEIIETIKHRADAQELNRGLSLSLPYFDDQSLEMKTHNFEIIPAGRIMFVSAFVVRASRREQALVGQDTRMNSSTRKYLLGQLKSFEAAFDEWKTR